MRKILYPVFLILCLTNTHILLSQNLISEAKKIHSQILSIDTHTDTPLQMVDSNFNFSERHDPGKGGNKIDLPRMKEGCLDAVFLGVFVSQGPRTKVGNEKVMKTTLKIFDAIYHTANKTKDLAELAVDPDDAPRLKKIGKRALYIGVENGYAIGNDLNNVKKFYDMGARYITLCHTKNNDICDSSNDTSEHNGLSVFGMKVINEMNKVGMIIDVSHISDKSFYDVIKYSKNPVIASHSCSRSVCNNPRNMSDSMLLALKKSGGVIQMCILSAYVKTPKPDLKRDSAFNALRAKFKDYSGLSKEQRERYRAERNALNKIYPQELATVSDVVDHIDHIVKVAGIDHVGIGTDFDGGGGVNGCFDVSEMYNITVELLKRGYPKKDIEKIWAGNFMRVFRAVQEKAKGLN